MREGPGAGVYMGDPPPPGLVLTAASGLRKPQAGEAARLLYQ